MECVDIQISFGRGEVQEGAQGPPLTPALIDFQVQPSEPAQAAAQAPAQAHLLAPGTDHHMSKEAIEAANKKYQEEDERLAKLNAQRVAVAAVEEELAATNREIQRHAAEKLEEKLAAEKREEEKKEAERKKAVAKKEKAAKEAAEKERAAKAKLAEEKEQATT